MANTGGGWLKGCALGCGGLAVLGVLSIVGMTMSVRSAFQDAHADRATLEQRHGGLDSYTPTVDGAVDGARIEAFLTVRSALEEIRSDLENIDDEVGEFEELGADGDPSMGEALPAVARLTKTVMGLPWLLGEIERTRNRALVEAGMGLGEYSYIYVVAYHDQLAGDRAESSMFSGTALNSRIRSELVDTLRRQLEGARSALAADDPWLTELEAEVAALDDDPGRVPWQDGLPVSIADSIAPFSDRIEAHFSPAMAEFDLMNSTVHNGGLTIEMS